MKTLKQILSEFEFTLPEDWCTQRTGNGWVHKSAAISDSAWINRDAVIRGGTVNGGTVERGLVTGGVMNGGKMEGGILKEGIFNGGTIEGGTVDGGVINGGRICGGIVYGGIIYGGYIYSGKIYGGTIHGGTMDGVTVHGGTIYGGTMRTGVIRGGAWHYAPLVVSGSRGLVTNAAPGYILIDRTFETFAWWQSDKAASFMKNEAYSDAVTKEHNAIIQLMIAVGV